MNNETYSHVHAGGTGFIEMPRGLIAIWGKEAEQFLDGLITNDLKTLDDGSQMLAAFPNAQGRLLAVVRVLRAGDRFYFETEDATRQKLFEYVFRFTYAGDFFAEDLSDNYRYFELMPATLEAPSKPEGIIRFGHRRTTGLFVPGANGDEFREKMLSAGAREIPDAVYETIRIENGTPKYGIDMDESTVVPELGIEGLISYNKGCYIGQEIIARIHFRGHVAKQLTGLILDQPAAAGVELTSPDGKNAGRITSVTYSPHLDKTIALGFVRYDHLADGTELKAGETTATVRALPFVE